MPAEEAIRSQKLIVAFVVLMASSAFAGAIYDINCPNDKCRFKSELHLGGVVMYERAAGYCTTCKEFVVVKWDRHRPGMPDVNPPVAGQIWDGITGKSVRLFRCPKCDSLFGEIKSIDELKHCPQCSGALPTTRPVAVED